MQGWESVSWFLGFWFLGFGFLGFVVSEFLGFKDSWFLGSKVSKICQMSISCFLEEIDPISKISKIILDRSSGMFVARLFEQHEKLNFRSLITKLFFENVPGAFLDFLLGILGSPKMKILGFGAWGHVQKFRNHTNEEFRILP